MHNRRRYVKRRRSWLLTLDFEFWVGSLGWTYDAIATRSTMRDFCGLQQIVHHVCFLWIAASSSKLTYRSFLFFFARFILAQLICWFSSTAMQVAVSVNFLVDKTPFFRRCLLRADNLDAALLSVLCVALGNNESLNSKLRICTPETGRRRRRPAFSHRTPSSGAWGSGLKLATRGQPSNKDAQGWAMNDVILAATSETRLPEFPVHVPCSLIVTGWRSGLVCKKVWPKKKKKNDHQPVKFWAMLVEAETFFSVWPFILFKVAKN